MTDDELRDLVVAFEARTLPRSEWTHEAHLAVCWHTVRRLGRVGALDHLRLAIAAFNEATGGSNTTTSGYHETLTRYYVEAVADLAGHGLDDVLRHPSCTRDAPLRLWTRERLLSTEARTGWVPPDLAVDIPPR